jgi:hypothetical protein
VQRLVHLHGGRQGEEVRHASIEHARHDCDIHRRTHAADHQEDIVNVQKLVRGFDRQGHLVLAVFDDKLNLAPMDSAGCVRLVKSHPNSISGRHTPNC